jgi:hypothetical protein
MDCTPDVFTIVKKAISPRVSKYGPLTKLYAKKPNPLGYGAIAVTLPLSRRTTTNEWPPMQVTVVAVSRRMHCCGAEGGSSAAHNNDPSDTCSAKR